jgi:serine-type D-Ala-D-Ala carboxypeptidase/endopeptidase (penicillin-binding protein 4)
MLRQTIRAALCLAACTAGPLALAQTIRADPTDTPPPATSPDQSPVPAYSSLPTQIAALLAAPAVARDHWGIQVTTLDGMPLYSLNEAQLFQPASNAKLFTTAAALALLGPGQRFTTQAIGSGDLDRRGILHGDLKLVGGGDANFGANDLPYVEPSNRPKNSPPVPSTIVGIEQIADDIAAKGLHEVQGNVIGDDSKFSWEGNPATWQIEDTLWGYGAPVSALTIHDNEIRVSIAPDPEPHPNRSLPAIVRTIPADSYYSIQNHVYTMSLGTGACDARLLFRRAPGSKTLDILGDIPFGASPCVEHIAIEDPAEFAAFALKSALERRGVRITGSATAQHWDPGRLPGTPEDRNRRDDMLVLQMSHPNWQTTCDAQPVSGSVNPSQTVLATHTSPPLIEDITYTNKVSQNLHAELLVRDLGAKFNCGADVPSSLKVVRQWLMRIGLDPNDFIFFDGSGLSSHDLVTPRATAKLLQFATTQSWFAGWKSSLPIGGEDGTLETRFPKPPLKDHLFAKTGTLGEARALSGYLDAASGRTVIFSIMVGNHLPGTSDDREAMDKIVALIQSAE